MCVYVCVCMEGSEGTTFSNGHIDRRAKKEKRDECGVLVSFYAIKAVL